MPRKTKIEKTIKTISEKSEMQNLQPYTCPWCKSGTMKPNFENKKLVSISCDACGFFVSPLEKENK